MRIDYPFYTFAGEPILRTCDKCGQEKATAILRDLTRAVTGLKTDPPCLCTECCASYPTREWMAQS